MNLFIGYVICVSFCALALANQCSFPSLKADEVEVAQSALNRLQSLLGKTYVTAVRINNSTETVKFQLCDTPVSNCASLKTETIIIESLGSKCTAIGRFNDTHINVQKGSGSTWVALTFAGGDKRDASNSTQRQESTITFVCDPSQEDALTVVPCAGSMQLESHYSFVFNTKSLCGGEGLSGGSVFCIIFFTVAGVYFLFGFLYQRLVVKAKGVEQIPNYDKWKEFGNLVADGCDFVCRCGTRQEAKMYQGIDDPLGNEESETDERDDRLLPM